MSWLTLTLSPGGTRFLLEGGVERSWSVAAAFRSLAGNTRPNPALGAGQASVLRGTVVRHDAHGLGWSFDVEGGNGASSWVRLHILDRVRIALSPGELQVDR